MNSEYIELHNLLKQYELVLIVYVLKQLTDVDHALSCAELANHLNLMLPSPEDNDFFNSRTASRKVDLLDAILNSSDDYLNTLNHILCASFGGRIKYRQADGIYTKKNTRSNGSQRRYYFDPLLTEGDMTLIYGSLRSSRYLSESEKRYLMSRLNVLHPSYEKSEDILSGERGNGIYAIEKLPERPVSPRPKDLTIPGQDSTFLRNAQIIHSAIEKKVQLEIIYGIYDISEKNMSVNFHARNDSVSILNPYALLWNDGEYYLVASCEPHSAPTHYRVDRIMQIRIHKQLQDGEYKEVPRRPIPDSIREYFERDRATGLSVFNGIKYANAHPGMAIHKSQRITQCTFECTNWSLQILVDNFGPNLQIEKSDRPHNENELDYNGNPQEFLLVTIPNVQYDNVKRFAINNCQYLTLTYPQTIVDEVRQILQEAVNKL